MKYYLIIIFSFFSLLLPNSVSAQENYAKLYEKQGDKALEAQSYNESLRLYVMARRFVRNSPDLDFKIAQNKMMLFEYAEAEAEFKDMIRNYDTINLNVRYPKLYLYLAQVAKQSGKLNEANGYIEKSLKDNPDISTRKQLREEQRAIEWIRNQPPANPNVHIKPFGANINNGIASSGGQRLDTLFIFNKLLSNQSANGMGVVFENLKMYVDYSLVDIDFHTPSSHLKLDEINDDKYNTANVFYDTLEKVIYMTKNTGEGAKANTKIYTSRTKNGKDWSKPKVMDFCKDDKANYTHPFLVYSNGQKILFFASDRSGSFGGYDIWEYNMLNKYATPVNAGTRINTPKNEVTPFYVDSSSTLFFSSNGRAGFGGYDIYYSQRTDGAWKEPKNMQEPFNSPANDLYPVIVTQNKVGYLTSNRSNKDFDSLKTCCNRIFYWTVDGNAQSGEPIAKENTAYRNNKEVVWTDGDEDDSYEDNEYKSGGENWTNNYSKLLTQDFNPAFDLPLALYFHNDMPKAGAQSTISNMDYRTSYQQYLALRNSYLLSYQQNADSDGVKEIEAFFDNTLPYSYAKLESMFAYLLKRLQAGASIDVEIRGFSSSLFNANYNFRLSERRINSLEQLIAEWNNGALARFMEEISSKDNLSRLRIVHLPLGSSYSHSPNPITLEEKRQSVYNIQAMNERKIEIKIIKER
ncbi:MAG: hypothetical protein LBL74_05225 [Bacteroidales bacterium]|nr:hypothetical protein [Bacteroidales bacterium]